MLKKRKRTIRVSFVISEEGKALLDKLALIFDMNRTDVVEALLDKSGKEYGLIESRD